MSTYKCQNCGWRWRDSSFFEGVTCPKCTSNVKDLIEEPLHQSEAPSVDDLVEMIWASALDISTSKDFNTEAKYLKARENTLAHYSAKINRLIIEAELRGFDKAFDSHDYDGLREYRVALSNNLSKGDV